MPGSEGPSWRSNLGSLSQTGTRSLHLGVPLESSAPLQDGDPQTTPAEGAPPGCVSESPGRLLPHYIFLGPTSRNAGSVGAVWESVFLKAAPGIVTFAFGRV